MKYSQDWIENIDKNESLIYSDTDSQYIKVKLPFSKFDDVKELVNYTQQKAKETNDLYLNELNTLLKEYAGLDPDYNLMNFKSEVVAYRGFFRSKKYYALAKIWDEGNFFTKPKLKKTGGQILKADSTKITYDMLTEIYNVLVLNFELKKEEEIAYEIFVKIKNKYLNKIKLAINEFHIEEIGIPKKWGLKEFKSLPSQVIGAMFYNLIYQDLIRPGDSILTIQIKINSFNKILELYNKKLSKYQLPKDLIKKVNYLSVPTDITNNKEKKEQLKKIFKDFNIVLDFDSIVNYNIDMKIVQFENLFDKYVLKSLPKN